MQIFANGKWRFMIFFHGILCDTHKNSRGKNLIIVPLFKFSQAKSGNCLLLYFLWNFKFVRKKHASVRHTFLYSFASSDMH